ncbi:LysR family transcriptional regulator [Rhodoblastus sp. 17X3]|uniref:LysR family transcriptional regulator n=1 Tax=Rhodoblastus sp. 17X3 TaxID=3047026 RepID=UPI0024B7FF87|nr:LysR family transcriptional regulator [Rhodoblastus sp. 17X3]MDI9849055.1 LysR family transcriptional regulator [Rhodoblastus sp. 17X3]
MNQISWDDFRLVRGIAESGSLVGAAASLNLNHSTVFRRLGALEEMIGAKLFERSRNGYAATAAGQEMVLLAERMGRDVTDFERRIAGRDEKPSGLLRVTTNDALFNYVLAPILASFRKAYPDIQLDVLVTNQPLNLSRRDADIAVRSTYAPPETLVGRRIGSSVWGRYVSRTLYESGFDPADESHSYIAFNEQFGGVDVFDWIEKEIPPHRIAMRCNTTVGIAQCIAQGVGIGFLPRFIGDQHPELVCTDEPMAGRGAVLWLLTHPDLRHAARVRAFMDHAGAQLSKRRAVLSGGSGNGEGI